ERGHAVCSRGAGSLAEALRTRKNEGLVLPDGTAESAPVLVLRERRGRQPGFVAEETIRVENPVSQVFVCRAMIVVGSRLGSQVDHAVERSAKLRAEVVALHLEFLDKILNRCKRCVVNITGIDWCAVHDEFALVRHAAGNL